MTDTYTRFGAVMRSLSSRALASPERVGWDDLRDQDHDLDPTASHAASHVRKHVEISRGGALRVNVRVLHHGWLQEVVECLSTHPQVLHIGISI